MQEDQPVPGTDPEGRKRGRGDPGREQGGGGRILCSGRGSGHLGRIPDVIFLFIVLVRDNCKERILLL